MTMNYKCECSCGEYVTNFGMKFGTALAAAKNHSMLDGKHVITISYRRGDGAIITSATVKSNFTNLPVIEELDGLDMRVTKVEEAHDEQGTKEEAE